MDREIKRALPTYVCHKEVLAAKIKTVAMRGVRVLLEDLTIPNFVELSEEWMTRNQPQVGGYLVVYKDGFVSYSPAKAFEEGYSRKEQP